MTKLLYTALFFLILLSSCRKNNDNIQAVNINGTDYPTIVIGNQTWTSVNYRGAGGISYNSNATNDIILGKFYSLPEALSIVLPSGWRLPTRTDYETLLRSAGTLKNVTANYSTLDSISTRKLRATTGWDYGKGNNGLGFNAIASGYAYTNYLGFYKKGQDAVFWSSTHIDSLIDPVAGTHASMPFVPIIRNEDDPNFPTAPFKWEGTDIYTWFPYQDYRLSVRFVKDN